MSLAPTALAGLLALVLVGCVPDEPGRVAATAETPRPPTPTSMSVPATTPSSTSTTTATPATPATSSSQSPQPSTPAGTDCLIGRWRLDVADYEGQAARYLKSLSIPLQRLRMTGTQILDINGSPFLNVSTDLRIAASVAGRTIGWIDQSVGGGEWERSADTRLVVSGFDYTVDPEVPPGSAPRVPTLDFTGPLEVECRGDVLLLRGATAPLRGRFLRR